MTNAMSKLYEDRDWLYDQYITQKKILKEIGKLCSVSHTTICNWLIKFNIKRRSVSEALKGIKRSEEFRKKISETMKGDKNPAWKGGKRINHDNYWMIWKPEHPRSNSIYVAEHILIVEKMLSRYLTPEERVHHINMNKLDNRLENLFVCKKGENMKAHKSYNKCCQKLMEDGGILKFDRELGEYYVLA